MTEDWLAALMSQQGAAVFVGLLALMACLSTVAPAVGFLTLPRDTLEGFIWGRTFQWGFFKHPPLQAWILGASEWLAPTAPWLAYFYAQICVVVTLLAVWRLATVILGHERGLVAALLTLAGVHYYGPSMATFTPDTLSAPLWALTGLFWWRAVVEDRPKAWLWLAVVVAISVYAKYVGLLLVGVLGVFTLATPRGWRSLRHPEPWIGMGLALGIVTPHLRWMLDTGFSSMVHAFSYEEKAGSLLLRVYYCLTFLSAQLVQHVGLVVLLVMSVGFGRFMPQSRWIVEGPELPRFERWAVMVMAIGPIAVALAVNFIVGGEFRQGRGTAMFAFSGIAAMVLLGPRIALGRLRLAAAWVLIAVVALPIANAGHHHVRLALGAQVVPTLYPAQPLADQLTERWREAIGEPLRVVIGDRWHGGNVAFYSDDDPLILLDGDSRRAPWVGEDFVREAGALVVWHPDDRQAYEMLSKRYPGLKADGVVVAPSPVSFGPSVRLAYMIIAPAGP